MKSSHFQPFQMRVHYLSNNVDVQLELIIINLYLNIQYVWDDSFGPHMYHRNKANTIIEFLYEVYFLINFIKTKFKELYAFMVHNISWLKDVDKLITDIEIFFNTNSKSYIDSRCREVWFWLLASENKERHPSDHTFREYVFQIWNILNSQMELKTSWEGAKIDNSEHTLTANIMGLYSYSSTLHISTYNAETKEILCDNDTNILNGGINLGLSNDEMSTKFLCLSCKYVVSYKNANNHKFAFNPSTFDIIKLNSDKYPLHPPNYVVYSSLIQNHDLLKCIFLLCVKPNDEYQTYKVCFIFTFLHFQLHFYILSMI